MQGFDSAQFINQMKWSTLIPSLFGGGMLIILGLLCVASPNTIWKLQKIQNEWRGLASSPDKPKGWDTRWAIYGTVLVVGGIVVLALGAYVSANLFPPMIR